MAYNVKYRLDFADVQGRKRRLDILKNDYGGAILPLYSNGEPVVISTDSDIDFYEPIIGSQCTINLLVTDDVSYDNFYEYDEREYQVKVYWESSAGVYSLYWQGWISNDIYQEAIVCTPYVLTINANDGLGTLNGYNSWFPTSGDNETLWKIIWKNLQNIGLEQDIWISNETRLSTEATWKNVFADTTIDKRGIFHDNYTLWDAKTMLRTILMAFNCKIFQSQGRLHIVNSSTYGDQRIIAGIQAGTYTGSGILTAKQGFLDAGSEEIKYFTYSYLGFETGNLTANFLREVKADLIPLNQNLFREVRRPLKKYANIIDISQQEIDQNKNASLEFGIENWDVVAGAYTIDSNPFGGLKNIKYNDFVSTLGAYTEKINTVDCGSIIKGLSYDFICSVRVDTASTLVKVPWYVTYYDADSGNDIYWIDSTKSWSANSSILWNEKTIDSRSKYEQIKASLTNPPAGGVCTMGVGVPYIDGVSIDTYLDNIALRPNDEGIVYKTINFNRTITDTIKNSDVLEHEGVSIANTTVDTFLGAFVGVPSFKRCQDASGQALESIVTQQRLNDFRAFSKAYSGDFSLNSQYGILSMANKIWINFSNLSETDSAIMDSISFSVKEGIYSVRCHIPNNYTDVASTFYASFQE